MEIVIKGADFSALGLGSTRWVEKYITDSNITNTTYLSALRQLYTSLTVGGQDKKLEVLRLFFQGTAVGNSKNILDTTKYNLSFTTSAVSAHTTSGWQPATTHWGISSYKIKNISNFHMHAWNTTLETLTSAGMLGFFAAATGTNNLKMSISRGASTTAPFMFLGSTTGLVLRAPSIPSPNTGMLSSTRVGDVISLYSNASKIASINQPSVAIVDGTSNMQEGNYFKDQSGYTTGARLLCTAYGEGVWTDADEVVLYNAVNAFKTALGI